MMLPARRAFQLLGVNAAIALLVSVFPERTILWYVAVGASLLAVFVDLLLAVTEPTPRGERFVPHSLPLGVKRSVRLKLHNTSKRPLTLDVFDHFPLVVSARGFPLRLGLAVGRHGGGRRAHGVGGVCGLYPGATDFRITLFGDGAAGRRR